MASADTAVNQRALFVEIPARAHGPPSFLQQDMSQTRQRRQQHALELLQSEALRLHSSVLGSLAAPLRVSAEAISADPFAKVKDLIQKLVERLLAESTAEATKKGFCDEEMGKATKDRDYRYAEANKLSVQIGGLESKRDTLEADIGSLTSSLSSLRSDLNTSTQIRADDKVANLETVQQAKEGLKAVTDALAVLKDFYKSAAKAEDYHAGKLQRPSLVQKKASPVVEDTSGPGFDNAYSGKQEASTGIIGILVSCIFQMAFDFILKPLLEVVWQL